MKKTVHQLHRALSCSNFSHITLFYFTCLEYLTLNCKVVMSGSATTTHSSKKSSGKATTAYATSMNALADSSLSWQIVSAITIGVLLLAVLVAVLVLFLHRTQCKHQHPDQHHWTPAAVRAGMYTVYYRCLPLDKFLALSCRPGYCGGSEMMLWQKLHILFYG